jgi:hypothetical protein
MLIKFRRLALLWMREMARWVVENSKSGVELGRYSAETRQGALECLARDIGYRSYAEASAISGGEINNSEIRVTKIRGTK